MRILLPTDLSMLFPLSESATSLDELAPVETESASFFSREQFDRVAFDFSEGLPGQLGYQSLRMVSARLAPCEVDACAGQLRLVFQPTGGTDAALHGFYAMEQEDVEDILTELVSLRETHTPGLQVPSDWTTHPGLLDPSYRSAMIELVRRFARPETLEKIASFSFPGSFPDPGGRQSWTFRVAEKNENEWMMQPLSNETSITTQVFDTDAFIDPETRETREVAVDSAEACAVAYVSNPSGSLLAQGTTSLQPLCADENGARAALDRVAEILNPVATPTRDVDCSSCHLAPVVAYTLAARFPSIELEEAIGPVPGPFLAGISRAFGYHEIESRPVPIVSPRVRAETELAIEHFSR